MKKVCTILALALAVAGANAQSISVNFDVGILANNLGSPIADGSLLQVIASSDATFADPTDSAFVGGNDLLIYSLAFDSSTTGTPGIASFAMNIALSQFAVAGQNLMIRWYPTLSTQSSAPGFNTFYGEFSVIQDSSWVAPSAGNTIGLQLLTMSTGGGALADAVGYASKVTPVPEPATYAALIGALALGFVAYRRRQLAA